MFYCFIDETHDCASLQGNDVHIVLTVVPSTSSGTVFINSIVVSLFLV